MVEQSNSLLILDQIKVSPLQNITSFSATSGTKLPRSTTKIPLTFFDFPWLLCRPMQRLFFYQLPRSEPSQEFVQNTLPNLAKSLSMSLQHYFPFAAKLLVSKHREPYLLFDVDDCWVSLTVVESRADFDRVIANHVPRDARELHAFVPKLPSPRVLDEGGTGTTTRALPLLALQVTLFPNSGICIGAEFLHVAADGMAFNNFIKSWASIFRSNGDLTCLDREGLSPCHDRELIKDPYGLKSILLNDWWSSGHSWDYFLGLTQDQIFANKVRATYVLGQAHVKQLKNLVTSRCNNIRHLSTFVVTCAFVWVSLIKAKEYDVRYDLLDDNKPYIFCFVADCRNRIESKLPKTYSGNCLDILFVEATRGELLGESGIIIASKVIGDKIKELEDNGPLRRAETWMLDWREVSKKGNLIVVGGSPKLAVYETDFGWGKPKKSEVVHIDFSGNISLCDSRDDRGGVEVGFALSRDQMEVFSNIFQQTFKQV